MPALNGTTEMGLWNNFCRRKFKLDKLSSRLRTHVVRQEQEEAASQNLDFVTILDVTTNKAENVQVNRFWTPATTTNNL